MGTGSHEPRVIFVPKELPKMEIKDRFKIVSNHHSKLVERYHSLGTSIAQLTAAGCIDATEYWRDQKYLYLLCPMRGGLRKKKYIGNHPLRIEEARQKLQNYKNRLELITNQENIQLEIDLIELNSVKLLKLCSRADLSAKAAYNELIKNGYNIESPALSWCPQ